MYVKMNKIVHGLIRIMWFAIRILLAKLMISGVAGKRIANLIMPVHTQIAPSPFATKYHNRGIKNGQHKG